MPLIIYILIMLLKLYAFLTSICEPNIVTHWTFYTRVEKTENRHLLKGERFLMLRMNLPKQFWADATIIRCFLINVFHSLFTSLSNFNPLQLYFLFQPCQFLHPIRMVYLIFHLKAVWLGVQKAASSFWGSKAVSNSVCIAFHKSFQLPEKPMRSSFSTKLY